MTEAAAIFEAEQPVAQPSEKPPANAWIVSAYKFRRHPTLQGAMGEADRLRAQLPHKSFRIYRVKGSLVPSDAAEKIAELQRESERLASVAAMRNDAVNDCLAKVDELLQLVGALTDCLTDEGPGFSEDGLQSMRRRCANALPLRDCPDWLLSYRDAEVVNIRGANPGPAGSEQAQRAGEGPASDGLAERG
jgi:hypothetical protein